ncbi:hypothetical protein [Methylobrevis albus]|uniref:DUF4148 domain-containing protein n=1 Tax=Methylobrevis albus TaxID=2793297 RepID=A0A931I149_9HYPH|nr:hypothetical protein [Methylobrevis albus]MBH0237051.1 hypothetical protein [Methylobrevis albus]
MKLKTFALAAAFAGLSTAAFAAGGYHPGYSTSEIQLMQREARAAASGPAIGTRGAGFYDQAAPLTSTQPYTPGYSTNDLAQRERSAGSTHTLPATAGNPGTAFVSEP